MSKFSLPDFMQKQNIMNSVSQHKFITIISMCYNFFFTTIQSGTLNVRAPYWSSSGAVEGQ